jgi:hypothetical protein
MVPAVMATAQEAGDFGSRLARVLRRWRDEEEPQRLAEWQRRRQQPDDVDGGYAFTSDDGNTGQWAENVPMVARYRLAFADRDTTNHQPWTMDDDDDENESTDDTMSLSDEESDSDSALGDKRRTNKAMVISSRSGYDIGRDGECSMSRRHVTKQKTCGASPLRSSPRQEEGPNQSGPKMVASGPRDNVCDIWAPSLIT